MKVFTFSEARQRLAELLDTARREEVIIKRRGGDTFSVSYRKRPKSPFDVPGVQTNATTKDIVEAIRESRSRDAVRTDARRHGKRRA
ncbi:MAG TPA: prevent-host-death protein [Candidatus Hydrogenedentes bacterium]|nr:prevent-host-death protein [Candidatus Hydrogenedentota bacterium]HIJ74991.1 prevent-host-death protein [Candidatus Hydrogenedentota bacterium]